MDDELQEKLFAVHPAWFDRRAGSVYLQTDNPFGGSRMADGFCVGNGWYELIRQLLLEMESEYIHWESVNESVQKAKEKGKDSSDWQKEYLAKYPENPLKHFQVAQVKEKFGRLRVYVDGGPSWLRQVINYAERLSGTICEECGKPGRLTGDSYIQTLCKECCPDDLPSDVKSKLDVYGVD